MEDGDVLVTRRLPPPAMERLGEIAAVRCWEGEGVMPRERLLGEVAGRRALVSMLTDTVDTELLDVAGPQLRIVANYAVGYDNIDVAACTARGVLVTNTPDVLTEATADMTWALLLAAARRLAEGDRLARSGAVWAWAPEMMLGQEVSGATLGIVGFGRIGRAVARRADGFGMRVLVHGRRQRDIDLDALLAESDFVTLHVSLTAGSRHLIGARELALMKPTAVLVNTSRGPVVDEEALAAALDDGRIFAAGLDVYEREPEISPRLLAQPRAVLAPHLGSATVGTRVAMGMLAAANVEAALSGERPPSLVNPQAWRA